MGAPVATWAGGMTAASAEPGTLTADADAVASEYAPEFGVKLLGESGDCAPLSDDMRVVPIYQKDECLSKRFDIHCVTPARRSRAGATQASRLQGGDVA